VRMMDNLLVDILNKEYMLRRCYTASTGGTSTVHIESWTGNDIGIQADVAARAPRRADHTSRESTNRTEVNRRTRQHT